MLVLAAELAAEHGLRLYLVGGPVRDLLLGREIDDLDLLVDGHGRRAAPELGRALQARLGGELHIYEAFATATWHGPQGERLDLATARTEVYPAPAALPVVTPADLEADLRRRDLSVNALALALPEAELVDLFGGLEDLAAGRLRALHPRSFHDDPTRALRAARYAARYGFTLEPESRAWIAASVADGALEALGPERFGHELRYLLAEDTAAGALCLAEAWGLLTYLRDEPVFDDVLEARLGALDAAPRVAPWTPSPELRSAARWLLLAGALTGEQRRDLSRLVTTGGPDLDRWLRGLEPVLSALSTLSALPEAHGRGARVAHALRSLDEVERTLARCLADDSAGIAALDWWQAEGRHLHTVVDGRGLLARGFRPGPALGQALARAQDAAWDGFDVEAQWNAALEA